MLQLFLSLLILASCSMNTKTTGGKRPYIYNASTEYSIEDLSQLAHQVVETSKRDPHVGKLDNLFSSKQSPIKRIGIIIFESQLQPTRGGLAGQNLIYLSESGKQLFTESFLKVWEESINVMAPDFDYVKTANIKKSRSFHQYGLPEENFVKTQRSSFAPDDIFYLEKGRKTPTTTVVNPRGMRDVSFLLVPATELMSGPKWSEHNKHFVNDVAKELELDAAIIVMSEVSWTAAHTEKNSGEHIPEEIEINVKASTLIPLYRYHQRLEKLRINSKPNITLAYRAYKAQMNIPVTITVPQEAQSFETIESELLVPMFKTYKDLSQMTIMRIISDLKKTW